MLNRVILIGRLTRDPEDKTTGNGTAKTNFTLACDRPFTGADGKKEADFIPVETWRGLAESCLKYLAKGRLCAVEGRIQVDRWGKDDGTVQYLTKVVADNVRFLGSERSESSEGTNTPPSNSNAHMGASTPSDRTYVSHSDPFKDDGRPIDISEDSLPF